MEIILASASPSRKKILSSLGIKFKVIPSNIDEEELKAKIKDIPHLVKKLAFLKAKKVEGKVKEKGIKNYLIVGVDSLAAMDNIYLDKPKNENQARRMLALSKGRSHKFFSGIAVISSSGRKKIAISESTVFFRKFTNQQLDKIIKSGIWKGRAGGYDIEKDKGRLIEGHKGSYTNVLGLPIEKLREALADFKIKI